MSGKSLKEVNWAKVGVSALSGGVSAAVPGGFITAAVIGGTTDVAFDAIDGNINSVGDAVKSFAWGAVKEVVSQGVGKALDKGIGKLAGKFAGKSGSNTHVPSANTQVVRHPEIKSPNQVKMSDVTNYWDDYLGSNQTNIHPRTGLVDNDRIFSADGTKSIRFGNHEMDSMGTTKFHFHLEEWKYDPVNDVMEYFNTLVRIKR